MNNIEGKVVVITGARRADRIQALAEELSQSGGKAMPHSPLERLKIEDWDQMIDVNIKGVLYGIAAALPHMTKQKSGHIINVSSVISPGAVATELPNSATEPDVAQGLKKFYDDFAISADSFARAVIFAMSQPEDVDINEILFRPTRQVG